MWKIVRIGLYIVLTVTLIGLGIQYLAFGHLKGWPGVLWTGIIVAVSFLIAGALSGMFDHIFHWRGGRDHED